MDALKRTGQYRFDSQVARANGRMFPGRTLSVALSPNDNRIHSLLLVFQTASAKGGINRLKYKVRIFWNIGAVFQPTTGRHNIIRSDLIAHLDGNHAGQ